MDYKKPQSTLVRGGVGLYPLTTADQVILADGSRLEKDGRISADSAANSEKLGGKSPEYYIRPRNLLDNSDFGNPVNQRGQTNYTTALAYGIDRWLVGEVGTMWIAEDSPTGKNVAYSTSNDFGPSYMWQKVRETLKAGKTYTFAVSFYFNSGHIVLTSKATDLGIATSANSSEPSGIVILTFTPNVDYTVDDGSAFVRIHTSGTIGLNWAALYEGEYTADTLPPYVPKGYAAELVECRRFFQPKCTVLGRAINQGYIAIPYNFSPPMRIKPSCMAESVQLNGINDSIYSGDMPCAGNNSYVYQCSGGGDIYTTGGFYQIVFNANADL